MSGISRVHFSAFFCEEVIASKERKTDWVWARKRSLTRTAESSQKTFKHKT